MQRCKCVHVGPLLAFGYILLATLVTHASAFSSLVNAIVALPCLILIPLLVGNLVFSIPRLAKKSSDLDLVASLILKWLLGCLTLFALGLVVLLNSQNTFLLSTAVLILCGLGAIRTEPNFLNGKILLDKTMLVLSAFGLIPILVVKYFDTFPLPVSLNWLLPASYLTYMNYITQYGVFSGIFDPTHPPLVVLIYSVVSILLNVSPLSLLWAVPFLLGPILGVGTYLFVYRLTKNRLSGIIASLMSVWLLSGTPGVSFPKDPEPPSVLFALFPLGLYVAESHLQGEMRWKSLAEVPGLAIFVIFVTLLLALIKSNMNYTSSSPLLGYFQILVVLCLALLILLNSMKLGLASLGIIGVTFSIIELQYIGVYFASLIFLYVLVRRIASANPKLLRRSLYALGTVTAIYILLQLSGLVTLPIHELFESIIVAGAYPPYSFQFEWSILLSSSGAIVLILLPVAAVVLIRRSEVDLAILTIMILILLAFFLPDYFSYRFLNGMGPFLAYSLSILVSQTPRVRLAQSTQQRAGP